MVVSVLLKFIRKYLILGNAHWSKCYFCLPTGCYLSLTSSPTNIMWETRTPKFLRGRGRGSHKNKEATQTEGTAKVLGPKTHLLKGYFLDRNLVEHSHPSAQHIPPLPVIFPVWKSVVATVIYQSSTILMSVTHRNIVFAVNMQNVNKILQIDDVFHPWFSKCFGKTDKLINIKHTCWGMSSSYWYYDTIILILCLHWGIETLKKVSVDIFEKILPLWLAQGHISQQEN